MLRLTTLLRRALMCSVTLGLIAPGCLGRSGLDDPDAPATADGGPVGGAAGLGGRGGRGGTSGRGGSVGTGGSSGRGGSDGAAGTSGAGGGGTAGTLGRGGTSGRGGTAGTGGTAGRGGTAGTSGTAGTAGTGGQAGCGSQSCMGCCDRADTCLSGSEINACGTRGVDCSDCSSLGFNCTMGVCEGMPPVCGPSNCRGCCDAAGVCRVGTDTNACGRSGQSCSNCTQSNQGCVSGVCQGMPPACGPNNCGGCCDIGGRCQPGTRDNACGSRGAACSNCTTNGRTCTEPGNYCAFFPTCSSVTCPTGCCDSTGTCRTGRSNTACGASGQTCADCSASGQACAAQGFCYTGTHCGPDNCAGCCTATGMCRPGIGSASCGQYGALCDNCTAKSQTCQNQVCSNGSTCPAAYPGCSPAAATTPPFSSSSCSGTDLTSLATACAGANPGAACATFLQRLLQSNPSCYDCVLQFTGEDAVVRCVAPYLTNQCNHDLTCAVDCSNTSCNQCPAGQSEACRNQTFGTQGGQCQSWINGYYCLQAALGGPAQFCDFDSVNDVGRWLSGVGRQYCAR
jgi:hypothetical protein